MDMTRVLLALLWVGTVPVVYAGPAEEARSAFNFFDYTVARRAWEPLAEAGHPDAQYGLYQIYSRGLLIEPDQAVALRWLRPAANQGHAAAQFYLGLTYLRGDGLEQNFTQAWVWFSRSEKQNFPTSERARISVENRLTPEQLIQARRLLNAP